MNPFNWFVIETSVFCWGLLPEFLMSLSFKERVLWQSTLGRWEVKTCQNVAFSPLELVPQCLYSFHTRLTECSQSLGRPEPLLSTARGNPTQSPALPAAGPLPGSLCLISSVHLCLLYATITNCQVVSV